MILIKQMKSIKKILAISLLLVCIYSSSLAQGISGSNPVYINSTHTYTYTPSTFFDHLWTATKGTIVSETINGLTYSVTVRWTSTGTGNIKIQEISDTQGGGLINRSSRNITINACPTIAAPTLTNGERCGPGSVVLNSNNPGANLIVRWYNTATSTDILATGITFTTPALSVTRDYHASVYSTTTQCESVRVLATAIIKPFPVATASPQTICSGGQTNISLSGNLAGTTFQWTVSAPGISGASSGSGSIIQQTLSQSTSSDQLAVYSITPILNGCSGSSINVSVTVKPTPSIANAGADQMGIATCGSSSITLAGNIPVIGSGSWSIVSGEGGSFANVNSATSVFHGVGGSTYTLRWTVNNSPCAPSVDEVVIKFNALPISDAGVDQTDAATCGLMSLPLAANIPDAGTGLWTVVNGTGGVFSDPTSPSPSFSGTHNVLYTLRWTTHNICGSTYDEVNIKFNDRVNICMNENYIIVNNVQVDNVVSIDMIDGLSETQKNQSIQYFDGLGRLSQSIVTKGSPERFDIIQPVKYDDFGRESRNYLPYVGGTNGWLKQNAFIEQQTYYTNNSNSNIATDPRPYSETLFEASPLNRPDKDYGAGQAWAPVAAGGNNKFVQHAYLINKHGTALNEEKIIAWTLGNATNPVVRDAMVTGYITTEGYYTTGQLQIKSTKDEQGNEVREYTDKEGRVILKKVQATAAGATNLNDLNGWALTYYVYDDFGNLRFVLPPELSKLVHQNDTYNPTTTQLGLWAFVYRYDGRQRMIVKKVPGADSVYMVYDNRDRLVLTQDGNQRAGATNAIKYWTFTKYDELNRPILTGTKDTTTTVQLTQALMQAAVNAHYAKASSRWGESYIGNGVGNVHGYTNRSYPVRTGSTTTEVDANKYLTATYYDNYNFRSLWYGSYTYLDENLSEASHGYTYHQPDAENLRVIGQVTGTKTKVLDGNVSGISGGYTWLKSVTYYDDKYRAIQTIADNYEKGIDRVSTVYDFVGKPLRTQRTHTKADVYWANVTGATYVGNTLIWASGSSGWKMAAGSKETLPASTNGWMEWTIHDTRTKRIGFTTQYQDITTVHQYGIYQTLSALAVIDNGVEIGIGAYAVGDVIRIERNNGVFTFRKNGTLVRTSATTSSAAFKIAGTFFSATIVFPGVSSSIGSTSQVIAQHFDYDHAGRLLNTWHKLNGGADILLVKNEYNELGQLVDKKLHSTVSDGSNAKQSVDYRYNIRGWLTHINNAQVNTQPANNDDTNDLFGMELFYNQTDANLSNTALYNGNISATKWSSPEVLGPVKEKGYTYSYDELNRIKTSVYKEKITSWITPATSLFSETGFNYDLNGNILNLKRNETATNVWMDNLTYTYTGNQLMRVADAGERYAGFIDGTIAADDYKYDNNGNMTHDLNKGIGNALTDNTNRITYNFLNLPETVIRRGRSVRYIYDATGRKLAQVATFGTQQKQTDYVGEFQYENDQLQFISHEEGRISVASQKQIFYHDGGNTTGFTPSNATLAQVTQNGTSSYVRITSTGTTARTGAFPVGGTFTVTPGEVYKIRAKGYSTGANAATLLIKAGGNDLNWPGAALAVNVTTEMWVEQTVTIPTGATTLEAGVVWATVTSGEIMYINDFEIIKLETTAPEYQYHLKDHLGNTRLTFTSKDESESDVATLETANATTEQSKFLRYTNAKRINSTLFDRTNGAATGHAQRLNGGTNEKYGLAKSIAVKRGDKIKVEVYAKYVDPNSTNWTGVLPTLMSQIASSTAGVVIDGAGYGTSTSTFPFPTQATANTSGSSEPGPKAYLNWLVFDKNYVLLTGGFDRLSTGAREFGQDVAHERLFSPEVLITEPGFVYIFLSNEETTPLEVYFDDFKVDHIKSPVIQSDDYYAFGLTFNSYSRESSTPNQYLYNGKELQDELGFGLYDYIARQYDPMLGRFISVDPATELMRRISPYAYSFNNPLRFTDPDGMIPHDEVRKREDFDFDPGQRPYKPFRPSGVDCEDCDENDSYDNAERTFSELPQEAGVKKSPVRPLRLKKSRLKVLRNPHDPLKNPTEAIGFELGRFGASAYNFVMEILESDPGFGPSAVEGAAAKGVTWVFGAFKSEAKWASQLAQRGWTAEQITEAITKGKSFEAVNLVNKANTATRYVHPTTGQSVVIDDVTREIIHVGGEGFKY
jgi:RHS repeat-associated protein